MIGETVNTTSGEIARVIDSAQVDSTALNGRNYLQLITMIPDVATLDEDQMALTTSLSTSSQSVNGNRTNANNYTVDGAFNMDAGSNSSQINNVGVEFIREVKIQTSNFSAEYGRMSGAAERHHQDRRQRLSRRAVRVCAQRRLRRAQLLLSERDQPEVQQLRMECRRSGIEEQAIRFWRTGVQDHPPRGRAGALLHPDDRATRAGDFSTTSKIYYPGTTTPVPNKNIASLIRRMAARSPTCTRPCNTRRCRTTTWPPAAIRHSRVTIRSTGGKILLAWITA